MASPTRSEYDAYAGTAVSTITFFVFRIRIADVDPMAAMCPKYSLTGQFVDLILNPDSLVSVRNQRGLNDFTTMLR